MDRIMALVSGFDISAYPVASGAVLSIIITTIGIPAVVRVSKARKLFDQPGDRHSHSTPTPRLGGTMIFAGVILSSVLFTDVDDAHELKYIIAGMLVLFFIGLKDDIVTLTPLKKGIGQIIAATIIVAAGDIRVMQIYGLFDIYQLSYLPSIAISIVIIFALINSINFIDGIDGLASGVGIIGSVLFGLWFLATGNISYSVVCFSLAGSLAAFFWFNVFGKVYKIFLGDTGSMLIGFLLAVFTIRFINLNSDQSIQYTSNSAPAMALAILFIPVFDAVRILLIRLKNGKSVFVGDRNHLHHKVLKVTGSHLRATITLLLTNLIIIAGVWIFRDAGNRILVPVILAFGIGFTVYLGIRLHYQNNNHTTVQTQ